MSKPLLIFGAGSLAEQAHYYFTEHAGRRVDAFVVDAGYLSAGRFCDLPVLAADELASRFPPATHDLFVAIGYTNANQARKRTFLAMQARGYSLPSFIHEKAVVARHVQVGANTLVRELAAVSPFAVLGDNLVLGVHVSVSHHVQVGSHSYLSVGSTICGAAVLGECCFVGANSTVRDRVTVGAGCTIGAGAVIMDDCVAGGVYPAPASRRRQAPAA
jgi:sugar O-acyltransferase (sialic acid O-acetyltransferase NeuD family)